MSVVKDFLIRPMNISTLLNPACSVPPSVLAYAMLKSCVLPYRQRTVLTFKIGLIEVW